MSKCLILAIIISGIIVICIITLIIYVFVFNGLKTKENIEKIKKNKQKINKLKKDEKDKKNEIINENYNNIDLDNCDENKYILGRIKDRNKKN